MSQSINYPNYKLRDGSNHPSIGFGTYKVGYIPTSASSAIAGENVEKSRSAEECVYDALLVGYRFLECAEFYGFKQHKIFDNVIKILLQ